MKNLKSKFGNIIKFKLVLIIFSVTIGCVDSLNAPYPGTIFNENLEIDSTTDIINPPTELSIREFTAGTVFGLWWYDNSEDEDGFEVWRKDGTSESYKLIQTLLTNASAYNDTITNVDLTYFYKVRAVKSGHYSIFSNEVNTEYSLSLIAPSDLNAVVIPSTTHVTLNWNDNSTNELGFIIERKIINEFEFIEVARVGPNNVTWTDTSDKLQYGLTVYYLIRAYNTLEQSNNSNMISITL